LRDREHEQLLRSRREATTDALTGLGNRRKLLSDLEQALAQTASLGPRALLLFDLDGFKAYNDTFGHPAGDSLLQRVAEKLRAAVLSGDAYRLGGDEFCVLTAAGEDLDAVTFASAQALSEQGDGFRIGSSWGRVLLHEEADNATAAMQIADRRMYTQKNGGRHSANRQTRDVLLATLAEREPELGVHLHDVAELADNVGRLLGLSPVALDELKRAAELHDIGKVAIPDSIVDKPGTLSPDEWAFMRRHTLIGERILLAAPAMAGVARLVRSHHEFFDGTGYPDSLSGEDIPLGARIIAVCDAFHAMTHARVYREAMPTAEAIAELSGCAGTQFDPTVVAAIVAVVGERAATPA
jgi:diguanylate cyclase (GGDEF)-like protein